MTTDDFVVRVRREHDRVNELSDQLRQKVAVVPRSGTAPWLASVRECFEHFRAHMYKHMALEERDGYMDAVVTRRPTLSPHVDRLRHEHVQFCRILDGLHTSFESLQPEERLLALDCCRRVEALLGYIQRHEDDENTLVGYAFTQDVGTTD